MLENLRRKSLVHSYSNQEDKISFELGCATYNDLLCMPYTQRLEKNITQTRAPFKRAMNNLTKLLKVECDAFGYKFNMILCPKVGKVKPFLLGETPVTQELYIRLKQVNSSYFDGVVYLGTEVERNIGTDLSRPVEKLTVVQMMEFCNALSILQGFDPCYSKQSDNWVCDFNKNGYRLPEHTEWVYAAKAGTKNTWAGTNDVKKLPNYAWYKANSNLQTHPTKTKLPNEWGFYDMSGNVQEVCWLKKQEDDEYPLLGGSYFYDEYFAKIGESMRMRLLDKDRKIGFRLARTIIE
jgi:formylglycine-generating enzyme required for sulfatase activity